MKFNFQPNEKKIRQKKNSHDPPSSSLLTRWDFFDSSDWFMFIFPALPTFVKTVLPLQVLKVPTSFYVDGFLFRFWRSFSFLSSFVLFSLPTQVITLIQLAFPFHHGYGPSYVNFFEFHSLLIDDRLRSTSNHHIEDGRLFWSYSLPMVHFKSISFNSRRCPIQLWWIFDWPICNELITIRSFQVSWGPGFVRWNSHFHSGCVFQKGERENKWDLSSGNLRVS